MGLGTFGLYPGKTVSVTEHFTLFDGNLFTFFDEVFAKDPDYAAELKSIPPPPADTTVCHGVLGSGQLLNATTETPVYHQF